MDTGMSSVDHANDLLAITCGISQQFTVFLQNLAKQWQRLGLVCHSPESEQRLKSEYLKAEVIRTNLRLPKEPERILKDAMAVYHVEPSFAHRQAVMGFNMIDAANKVAKEGIFKDFVIPDGTLAQLHYPPTYSLHVLFLVAPMLAQGNPVYMASWNPNIPFSLLALNDLAQVGAKVLNEREKHCAVQYPLCSDSPLNYHQICDMASREIGKQIVLKQKTYDESVQGFLIPLFGSFDVDAESINAVELILLYYNRHALIGSSNVCEWLLGRKPTTWLDWMRAEIKQIKQQHQ
ncbi:MAG: hypothetical protein Q9225_007114 [Loekoesia sp. 1 TL-2023]